MPLLEKDYTGQTVVNRKILGFSHFTRHSDPMWDVQCICGNKFKSLTQDLKRVYCRMCKNFHRRKRPFESLYNVFVGKNLKRNKHTVDISYEEFLEFTKITECHYCGAPIEWLMYQSKHNMKGRRHKGHAYNLDRKDSNLGYTIPNVVVCCGRCNFAKNNHFTYNEWLELAGVIRSWRM